MMAINIKVDVLYVLSRCAARFQLYMCIHTCKPLDEPNLIIIIIIIYIFCNIYVIISLQVKKAVEDDWKELYATYTR